MDAQLEALKEIVNKSKADIVRSPPFFQETYRKFFSRYLEYVALVAPQYASQVDLVLQKKPEKVDVVIASLFAEQYLESEESISTLLQTLHLNGYYAQAVRMPEFIDEIYRSVSALYDEKSYLDFMFRTAKTPNYTFNLVSIDYCAQKVFPRPEAYYAHKEALINSRGIILESLLASSTLSKNIELFALTELQLSRDVAAYLKEHILPLDIERIYFP